MDQSTSPKPTGRHAARGPETTAPQTPVRDKYVGRRRRQPEPGPAPSVLSRFRQILGSTGARGWVGGGR